MVRRPKSIEHPSTSKRQDKPAVIPPPKNGLGEEGKKNGRKEVFKNREKE